MKTLKRFVAIILFSSLCMAVALAQSARGTQQEAVKTSTQDVLIIIEREQVRFTAQNTVAQLQLQVFDQAGELVHDSGAVSGQELTWVLQQAGEKPVKSGLYAYALSVHKVGSETPQVRRGHFIVDRAKDRDAQTDRLWITTQNDSGVGTELTVARNESVTIAGANPTSEEQAVGQTNGAARDGEGELGNARTQVAPALQGQGTAGRIAKFVSATSVGDSVMTELNGNVGVGTTNPTSKIEVAAQDGLKINGYQPFLTLQDSNSGGRRSYIQGVDGDLIFIPNNFAGNSAGMILRDSNKPGSRVDIFGQDALTMVGFQPFLTLTDSNAGWARARIQNVNGGINFQTHNLTNVGGSAMYIQNGTQNVGIGTANPQARLDVNGATQTSVLLITGGSDFAENFDVNVETTSAEEPKLEAGMVVSLDPSSPGKLTLSTRAYDRLVAGIISGAGGVKPGMVMGQEGTLADGKHPVALSGRVYCWVDASQGAIEVGNLLTTSSTPGYAMKATDAAKAQGAIIGKAMTRLEKGKGLVLVLVALQ